MPDQPWWRCAKAPKSWFVSKIAWVGKWCGNGTTDWMAIIVNNHVTPDRWRGKLDFLSDRLLANDIAIIGYDEKLMKIHEGTKVVGLRYATVRAQYPELKRFFPEGTNKESWTTKVFLEPSSLGIHTESRAVYCTKAVMVHLDSSGKDKLSVTRTGGSIIRLLLYEDLSRNIRGVTLPFIGGERFDYMDYMPSFDRREFHEFRVALINHLLDDIGLYYISSGNMEEIASAVDTL